MRQEQFVFDQESPEQAIQVLPAPSIELQTYFNDLKARFLSFGGDKKEMLAHMQKYLGNHAVTIYNGSIQPIVNDSGTPGFDMDNFIYECTDAFDKLVHYVEHNKTAEILAAQTAQERADIFADARRELGMVR